MLWVSEQRLVDKANAIHRNSWMTELETEKLDETQLKMIVIRKKKEVLMIQVVTQEKKSDILTALEVDEEIGNFEEEETVIIEEIEVLERRQIDVTSSQRYTKEEVIIGNC